MNLSKRTFNARLQLGLSILIGFLMSACHNEIEVDVPDYEQKVVCNCLFSPDTTWSVWVGYTQPFMSMYNDYDITDAHVFVIEKGGDTLQLVHKWKGNYVSQIEKPEVGVSYKLSVQVNGEMIESTWSAVPQGVSFHVDEAIEKPGPVWNGYGYIDYVMKVVCSLTLTNNEPQRIMIMNPVASSNFEAEVYVFNRAVLDSLQQVLPSDRVYSALNRFEGDTIYTMSVLAKVLSVTLGDACTDQIVAQVSQVAYVYSVDYNTVEPIFYGMCLSESGMFETFDYTDDRLIGTFDQTKTFPVYVHQDYSGDGWLQFNALSEEAYNYFQTYYLQLDSRADFSEGMQRVYSNLSNGVGIFAGYTQQRFLIKSEE